MNKASLWWLFRFSILSSGSRLVLYIFILLGLFSYKAVLWMEKITISEQFSNPIITYSYGVSSQSGLINVSKISSLSLIISHGLFFAVLKTRFMRLISSNWIFKVWKLQCHKVRVIFSFLKTWCKYCNANL